MSRFAYKAVALGTALALAISLVGSVFAEGQDSTPPPAPTPSTPSVSATTQSGSNTAQVVQSGSVSSGTAVASAGATAKTGDVTVKVETQVSQSIDQDADTTAKNGSAASTAQDASNTANVAQAATASSGQAVATGSKAEATSGDATAKADAKVSQSISQNAETEAKSTKPDDKAALTNGSSSGGKTVQPGVAETTQSASNVDITLQTVSAQSGDAAAIVTGGDNHAKVEAQSGDATAKVDVYHHQNIDQNNRYSETETIGGVALVSQMATQTINAVQNVGATSGIADATAAGETDDSTASVTSSKGHEVEKVSAESGDVYAEADATQLQCIEQEADAFAGLFEIGGFPLASIDQTADNTSIVNQFGVAQSGDAVAILAAEKDNGGSDLSTLGSQKHEEISAETGDVYLWLHIWDAQSIDQDAEATAIGPDAVDAVVQDAMNTSCLLQGMPDMPITANSGDALAEGTSHEGSEAESGDVGSWWHPAEFGIWSDLDIDQDADGFVANFFGVHMN